MIIQFAGINLSNYIANPGNCKSNEEVHKQGDFAA